MRRLQTGDLSALQAALASELRKSETARFVQRLHVVWLIGQGRACAEVAQWFELSPRTVQRWVRAYRSAGVASLFHGLRHGRSSVLRVGQRQQLQLELQASPAQLGYSYRNWSGKLLAVHLATHYGHAFSARQCQRILKRQAAVHGSPDAASDATPTVSDRP